MIYVHISSLTRPCYVMFQQWLIYKCRDINSNTINIHCMLDNVYRRVFHVDLLNQDADGRCPPRVTVADVEIRILVDTLTNVPHDVNVSSRQTSAKSLH